ncbi:MAG: selenide, water dikinase SelD, partial [Bdellovibrionaceae bacterium]|nr:selenide, water dikinase SelD [Pseudobdellovibrionaceae bacterium]
PKTAMAILAFPLATMPYEIAVEVLQGASDKIAEAGANFVGGHSIDDDTLKFGLSVTGYVHPRSVWSNRKARAGDRLILTKPLGTGTLTAALKRQEVAEQDIAEGIESMARLNNVVDYLGGELLSAIQAATDVTGFGFAGHASHLMKASGLGLDVNAEAIPRFSQTMEFLERGYLTKAHRTNAEYTNGLWYSEVSPLMRLLLHDPQTSGGLLLAVDPTCSESIVQALSQSFPGAAMVGVFTDEHNKLRIVE